MSLPTPRKLFKMVSASQTQATHYLQFEIQWSSIVLIWYDYALTLPLEVKYVWGAKLRLSTFLYVFCRYALVANVLYILAIAHKLNSSCDAWYKVIGALSILGRAAVIVTFIARTYAVWGQNRLVLGYLAVLGLACVALDIARCFFFFPRLFMLMIAVVRLMSQGSDVWGHRVFQSNDLLSILMVAFEFSAVVLTSFRSVKAFRVGNSPWKAQKGGIVYMIFEQGIVYFSIVTLITTAAVILNYRAPSGFLQRLLNALLLPLSGLLTAHFLLHLRKWEHKHSGSATLGSQGLGGTRSGQEASTMHGFRAAPGIISTIVEEDFGSDPLARATETRNVEGQPGTETKHEGSLNRSSGTSEPPGLSTEPGPSVLKSGSSTFNV